MPSNPFRWKLHWQILAALALSAACAALMEEHSRVLGISVLTAMNFGGKLFLNALQMVVVPLILATIISGMVGLGADRNFGRLGLKTLLYYSCTSLLAILIGLTLVNLVQPGRMDPDSARLMISQAEPSDMFLDKVKGRGASDFVEVFVRMIPSNIFASASDNSDLLGVIFFSLLFGFFISRLPEKYKEAQVSFWQSAVEVMMKMADWVIAFAPIGVFCLVTPKLVSFGFHLLGAVSLFTATVLAGLALHFAGSLSLILWLAGRVNPVRHVRAMASALLTAFSTASSVATLPVTLECLHENAGVSRRITSFTVPLGATVNMDGTALYECVVVIFIAQIYGVVHPGFQFSFTTQFVVVLLALLTSVGVAGIPSASLVAIAVILGVVGLPLEYIGIVLVVDRLLDMCRTAVNIYSDSVGAVVIGRSEGESPSYCA